MGTYSNKCPICKLVNREEQATEAFVAAVDKSAEGGASEAAWPRPDDEGSLKVAAPARCLAEVH